MYIVKKQEKGVSKDAFPNSQITPSVHNCDLNEAASASNQYSTHKSHLVYTMYRPIAKIERFHKERGFEEEVGRTRSGEAMRGSWRGE